MLLDDWKRYLQDPSTADIGDFTALLTDVDEQVSPEVAFSDISGGTKVAARCRELMKKTKFNGLYFLPSPEWRVSHRELELMARQLLHGISDYLRDTGEADISKRVDNLNIFVTEDESSFRSIEEKSYPHEAITVIGDEIIDTMFDIDERLTGVKEVALGLTMNSYVANYILTGALKFPVDFRAGFDLYIGGGELAILHDTVALLVPSHQVIA